MVEAATLNTLGTEALWITAHLQMQRLLLCTCSNEDAPDEAPVVAADEAVVASDQHGEACRVSCVAVVHTFSFCPAAG